MKLKILYRKNLKMSTGKIAAQAVHAAIGLGANDPLISVVVLGVSDKKYREQVKGVECYRVHDAGYTEVAPLTETCAAFYEDDQPMESDKPQETPWKCEECGGGMRCKDDDGLDYCGDCGWREDEPGVKEG